MSAQDLCLDMGGGGGGAGRVDVAIFGSTPTCIQVFDLCFCYHSFETAAEVGHRLS